MADDDNGGSVSAGDDSYSETTSQGWLSKLGGAIKGVLIGLVMVLGAFPLLFWNEGRAVRTAKSLDEGRGAVVTTPSDKVDPTKEGKLVHTTGRAKTAETLTDPVFGVAAANVLSLKRKVEMYQWKESSKSEKKDRVGGGTDTVTTYSYAREWSETLIDSSKFKRGEGRSNPGTMPQKSEKWAAGKVSLGAYALNATQVGRITGDEAVAATLAHSKADMGRPLREVSGTLYAGNDPNTPQIGDLRITFTKVGEADITVVAKQIGATFEPYRAKAGSTVDLQKKGISSADEMFASAEQSNVAMTWVLRAVGFILMALGIGMMLKPLSVLASVLPILGDIIGAGTGIIAFLLAGMMSFVTIAIAWIFYRPLLGIALLVLAGGAVYGVIHLIRKFRAQRKLLVAQPV